MPKLEGCSFFVAVAAKTDMKWPSYTTDDKGSGKVYICNRILVTHASVEIKKTENMEILHLCKFSPLTI